MVIFGWCWLVLVGFWLVLVCLVGFGWFWLVLGGLGWFWWVLVVVGNGWCWLLLLLLLVGSGRFWLDGGAQRTHVGVPAVWPGATTPRDERQERRVPVAVANNGGRVKHSELAAVFGRGAVAEQHVVPCAAREAAAARRVAVVSGDGEPPPVAGELDRHHHAVHGDRDQVPPWR